MTEYDNEPVPGLPGLLPPGERILWQGAPEWRMLARTAFHTRHIAGYFVLLAALGALTGSSLTGIVTTLGVGTAGIALLSLLAWGTAKTTMYTITDRRVVMRIGMALPKCINLPFREILAADLNLHADGTGDLPLTLAGRQRVGYAALWPHARPWRIGVPQPMLRAIPDAANVAALLARSVTPARAEIPQPIFAEAVAA